MTTKLTDADQSETALSPVLRLFAEWCAAQLLKRNLGDDIGDRTPLYQQCNQKDREVRT